MVVIYRAPEAETNRKNRDSIRFDSTEWRIGSIRLDSKFLRDDSIRFDSIRPIFYKV